MWLSLIVKMLNDEDLNGPQLQKELVNEGGAKGMEKWVAETSREALRSYLLLAPEGADENRQAVAREVVIAELREMILAATKHEPEEEKLPIL